MILLIFVDLDVEIVFKLFCLIEMLEDCDDV